MQRVVIFLSIYGFLCLISAVTGITSFITTNDGYTISYYRHLWSRMCVAFIGCGLLGLAWLVFRGMIESKRLIPIILATVWASFVLGGTIAVGKEYPQETFRNAFLFAVMLGVVSLPVFIYSARRWRNQEQNPNDESDDAT